MNAVNPGSITTDFIARSADQINITFNDSESTVSMSRFGLPKALAPIRL